MCVSVREGEWLCVLEGGGSVRVWMHARVRVSVCVSVCMCVCV